MNYKDDTEMLLALCVATEKMTRHVAMFPGVLYVDVTANTNKLKHDLLMMSVKDFNVQTFIDNSTIIPSAKQ